MAFNDTLFQLGMDLTRSSTAQTEDHFGSAPLAQEDWNGSATDVGVARSAGQKLYIDLVGSSRLGSARTAEKALRQALEIAQGEAGTVAVRRSEKGCLNGRANFAGGHAIVEAWPSSGYVAFDLASDRAIRPELFLTALMDAFAAREAMIKRTRTEGDGARYKKPVVSTSSPAAKAASRPAEKPSRQRRAA